MGSGQSPSEIWQVALEAVRSPSLGYMCVARCGQMGRVDLVGWSGQGSQSYMILSKASRIPW